MEEIIQIDGRIRNASFTDYLLPTTLDMPPVVAALVEEPDPQAPLGAKGVGEPPVCGVPAAIANGIAAATGIRPDVLPMTPVRVWALLQNPAVV
jgi:CO/xanthine dehydrogenase Mo-binding subunit